MWVKRFLQGKWKNGAVDTFPKKWGKAGVGFELREV
jgi:hypothetical protein